MNKHISAIRIVRLAVMLLFSVIVPAAAAYVHKTAFDDAAVSVALGLLFFVVAAVYIEFQRLHNKTTMGGADDFRLYVMVFSVSIVLSAAFSFLPPYLAPVMLFPFFCMSTYRNVTGAVLGIYFAAYTALLGEMSGTALLCYLLVATIGCMLYAMELPKGLRVYTALFLTAVSVTVPALMEYLEIRSLDAKHLLILLCESVAVAILYLLLNDRLAAAGVQTRFIRYETILDESYILLRDIYNFSRPEYDHAKKVANICYNIASALGFDAMLAMAGGFYYRLGRMLGEPYIENGVKVAEENCFPTELVSIIAEYNGLEHLPSSRESALVHIVDSVAVKFEVLDQDTFAGGWNREIVVYQTMNDQSQTGIYDESGLSMNQFLKIRDLLVREGLL